MTIAVVAISKRRGSLVELTGDGHLWSISPSLAKLLGYLRNQASLLIGTSPAPETTLVCAADLPRFRELSLRRKRAFRPPRGGGGADDGDSKEEAEGERRRTAPTTATATAAATTTGATAPWCQAGAWSRMSRAGWASGGTTTSVAKSGGGARASSAKSVADAARPRRAVAQGRGGGGGRGVGGLSSFDSKEDPEEGGGGVARLCRRRWPCVRTRRPTSPKRPVRLQGLNGRQVVFPVL